MPVVQRGVHEHQHADEEGEVEARDGHAQDT